MNQRLTNQHKWLSLIKLSLAALLLFLTAACGNSNQVLKTDTNTSPQAEGKTGEAAEDTSPLEVSIMSITPNTPPAADDNVIKLAIEKATNSKLEIQWVSNNAYADKLNITLASGKLPELTMINNPFSSTFRSLVRQGALWDIAPYIKDYPNLSNGIPEGAWELTKMEDGGNYGIPRPRPETGDSFFIIRKDWLDKVGLSLPTTTEELYEVMKAFVEQDPDGNGQKDTIALAAYISASDVGYAGNISPVLGTVEYSFTGVNGHWKWEGNEMQYTAFLPEVRESLEYLAKAYQEKLLPEDLLSLKLNDTRDLFRSGKAGIVVDKAGTVHQYVDQLKEVDPDFQISDFYPLTSINGYTPKGSGFNGILSIPKTVPEAKMKRILKLVDTWMNPEVFDIQKHGIEGVHYQLVGGKKVVDKEKLKKDNGGDFNQIVNVIEGDWDTAAPTADEKKANELFKKVEQDRVATSVGDIAIGLYSPTGDLLLPELDKKIQDLKSKIILGKEPISAWDDFVEETSTDPEVIKMIEEMTEAYKTRLGK